jgi:hypothetical protein
MHEKINRTQKTKQNQKAEMHEKEGEMEVQKESR